MPNTTFRVRGKRFLQEVVSTHQPGIGMRCIRWLLRLTATIYAGAWYVNDRFVRCGWRKRRSLDQPVISIGNISIGGTGKTPLVAWVTEMCRQQGCRVGVLARGYHHDEETGDNDEIRMLRDLWGTQVAFGVGPDRYARAQDLLQKRDVDVFVLDDGFQHRALDRDLNILVVDARRSLNSDRMLPAGFLREPLLALRRADAFVLTHVDQASDSLPDIYATLRRFVPDALVAETVHAAHGLTDLFSGDDMALDALRGQTVALCSAIGVPANFQRAVESLGAMVSEHFVFTDHHLYGREDVRQMVDACGRKNVSHFIVTHKDAVKLRAYQPCFPGHMRCWVLHVQIRFQNGEEEFRERILSVIQR